MKFNIYTFYSNNVDNEDAPLDVSLEMRRRPEAIPMIDDENLENFKLIQMMVITIIYYTITDAFRLPK